jgi:uncharacterized protein with HEPN domain
MLDAARIILSHVAGVSEADFGADRVLQDAVLYRINVIGEAARRLSEDFRAQHPEVPWRDIIAMRNRVVRDYESVDPAKVWLASERDVPELIRLLEPLLR